MFIYNLSHLTKDYVTMKTQNKMEHMLPDEQMLHITCFQKYSKVNISPQF